jgi:Protein of unknown function (DUF1161)
MLKFLPLAIPLALACTASYASNCEALRAQIEGKIKAAGVASFTVTVVDTTASAAGKVVGSCDKGAKKIIYVQNPAPGGAMPAAAPQASTAKAPASAAKAPASMAKAPTQAKRDAILTECKDGSTSIGGSCKK